MAGKRFNIRIKEIMPNTYINYETGKTRAIGESDRGTVLLPLIGADYGPEGEVIEIMNNFPNQRRAMLGHDIYDDTPHMFLIRQALMNALKVKCYIPKQGPKAKALPLITLPETPPEEQQIMPFTDGLETGEVTEPDNTNPDTQEPVIPTVPDTGDGENGDGTGDGTTEGDGSGDGTGDGTGETDPPTDPTNPTDPPVDPNPDDTETTYPDPPDGGGGEDDTETTYPDPPEQTDPPQPPEPASMLTAEAKYGGERGNDLSFSIIANPAGGYDVSVYLGTEQMESFEGLKVVEDLILEDSAYITFGGYGTLPETAGAILSGGGNGQTTNEDMLNFLDAMDNIKFTTLVMPITGKRSSEVDNTELLKATRNKIVELRDGDGKYVNAVFAQYKSNHESIINVTNGYELPDGMEVPPEKAVAWVGGLTASSTNTQSNTWVQVPDAVKVYKPKTSEQQKQAILDGEFFFIEHDDNKIIICKDINSLTDFASPNEKSYRSNRIMRVIDTLCEEIMIQFPPNRFSNNTVGWDLMDSLCAEILKTWEDKGAIRDVEKGDMLVDRSESSGEEVYVEGAIRPVNSAETLYFTIKTL